MADPFRKLQAQLRDQGWRLEPTRKGTMAYSPDGTTKVLMHDGHAQNDPHAYKNLLRDLKRGGFAP